VQGTYRGKSFTLLRSRKEWRREAFTGHQLQDIKEGGSFGGKKIRRGNKLRKGLETGKTCRGSGVGVQGREYGTKRCLRMEGILLLTYTKGGSGLSGGVSLGSSLVRLGGLPPKGFEIQKFGLGKALGGGGGGGVGGGGGGGGGVRAIYQTAEGGRRNLVGLYSIIGAFRGEDLRGRGSKLRAKNN